jgi:phenylalanyl-tRNA synthetase beta chain
MNGAATDAMQNDRHLGRYLHIIRDAPAYPIIYDKHDRVLSMPPIINSQRESLLDYYGRTDLADVSTDSKIVAGKTKNIFIDTTATDKTKLDIVINMVATMFSEYCAVPFSIEPVKIHMPDGTSHLSPPIAPRITTASSSYINAACGLSLPRQEISTLLTRMSLSAQPSSTDQDLIEVEVPCTRPDILHECDIMEDAAIAYGFNELPRHMPTTNTVAKAFPVNKLADILRKECAMAGWIEALPLILVGRCTTYRRVFFQQEMVTCRADPVQVLARRELCMAEPSRSGQVRHRPRQPCHAGVSGRPHLSSPRHAQDRA